MTVIDLSRSPDYRRGHIPGAWFAIRSRLDRAIAKIAPAGDVVLTSEDGVLASLAVDEVKALTKRPVSWLKGGNAAWRAAGFPLTTSQRMADEPVDVWLKPYEQPNDTEAAMNAYPHGKSICWNVSTRTAPLVLLPRRTLRPTHRKWRLSVSKTLSSSSSRFCRGQRSKN